jgi:hypothetical protein
MQSFSIAYIGVVASGTLATGLTGPDAGHFAILANTCAGAILAPGGGCTLTVRFAPGSPGPKGTLLHVSDSVGRTASATLSGTGGQLTIVPASHSFGTVEPGSASTPQSFTVTSVGDDPTGPLVTSLTGTGASAFQIVSDGCAGATLAKGETCAVDVRFAPASAGLKAAALAVGGGDAPVSSSLSGTGAGLTVNPRSGDFGLVRVDGQSTAMSFTVAYAGDQLSGALDVGMTGPNPTQFQVVSDGCSGSILEPGDRCTLSVRFEPTAIGAMTASLDVSAEPGGSASAALSGTGA